LGELTTAVFVMDALFGNFEICTVMVTAAAAPLAMFPKLQRKGSCHRQEQWMGWRC
jgi:hypothetical protein